MAKELVAAYHGHSKEAMVEGIITRGMDPKDFYVDESRVYIKQGALNFEPVNVWFARRFVKTGREFIHPEQVKKEKEYFYQPQQRSIEVYG